MLHSSLLLNVFVWNRSLYIKQCKINKKPLTSISANWRFTWFGMRRAVWLLKCFLSELVDKYWQIYLVKSLGSSVGSDVLHIEMKLISQLDWLSHKQTEIKHFYINFIRKDHGCFTDHWCFTKNLWIFNSTNKSIAEDHPN